MLDKSPGWAVEYHRALLADTLRTRGLERAIAKTVKHGDVVLDLGCGSGILACFACRAGARRVYAIESGAVIELARTVCRENGFADRVVFFEGLSTAVELPEPVDVVVTETIGNLGLEEGIVGWVRDARRRFLKPGGAVIPQAIELFAVPVELPEAYGDVTAWESMPYGLDLRAGRRLAANNLHWVELMPANCLGEPAVLARIDLRTVVDDGVDGRAVLEIARSGICHGIGGWFRADLTDALSLSNAPPGNTPNWRQGFFPLAAPLPLAAGDRLDVTIEVRGNGAVWRWRVNRAQADGGVPDEPFQSTLHGQMLSLASLRKGAPDYRPRLGDDGQSDGFILTQMDGSATVAEIARHAAARFPDQFAQPEEAQRRVRHLARKYSQ